MEIPYQKLKRETLDEILKEFILREGTDYGCFEWTLEDKKEQIHSQIRSGKARIVYDEKSESCTIIPSANSL